MGCGNNNNVSAEVETGNCACRTLREILAAQEENNNNGCASSCAAFALNPTSNGPSTIPFILTTKANTLFYAFGNLAGTDCFASVYFKVKAVDDDCCAVLEILEPNEGREITGGGDCCVPLNQVCSGGELELMTTGCCITVDLDCICAVQCFDPSVVVNG